MATLRYAIYPAAASAPTYDLITGWSGTPIVSGSEAARETTGVQTWATLATGLDPATDYKIAFVWEDGIDTSVVAWSDLWATLAAAANLVRATETISAGPWLPSTPAASLHNMVNSATPNDVEWMYAETPGTTRHQLDAALLPALKTRGLEYRISGTVGGVTMRVYQGATLVSTRVHTSVPASFTQFTLTLSEAEAALVTDGTNLFYEVEATL